MKLKEYLKQSGINVSFFAKKVRVSRPTIYRIFSENKVSLDIAERISFFTNNQVSISEIPVNDNDLENAKLISRARDNHFRQLKN